MRITSSLRSTRAFQSEGIRENGSFRRRVLLFQFQRKFYSCDENGARVERAGGSFRGQRWQWVGGKHTPWWMTHLQQRNANDCTTHGVINRGNQGKWQPFEDRNTVFSVSLFFFVNRISTLNNGKWFPVQVFSRIRVVKFVWQLMEKRDGTCDAALQPL